MILFWNMLGWLVTAALLLYVITGIICETYFSAKFRYQRRFLNELNRGEHDAQ